MARKKQEGTASKRGYCPSCREEFLVYNTAADTIECPSCRRKVPSALRRRMVSCGIYLLLAAIAAAAVGAYLLFFR